MIENFKRKRDAYATTFIQVRKYKLNNLNEGEF